MRSGLKAFAAFWYDFLVGDDWRVAVGVAFALAVTFAVGESTSAASWWMMPLAVVLLLPYSLWRVVRRTEQS
jgi:hypothetical protein